MKFSATNIDHIEANQAYKGNYGAGSLHTGRAVKMVYDLYTASETAIIENQKFSRWNFKLTSLSEKVFLGKEPTKNLFTCHISTGNLIEDGGRFRYMYENDNVIGLEISNATFNDEGEYKVSIIGMAVAVAPGTLNLFI